MLVVYYLLSAMAEDVVVVTDKVCSTENGHPENGGYYVTGFGYKEILAHDDPNDESTYGDWGMQADDTDWNIGKEYPTALPQDCTPYPDYGPQYMCQAITDNFKFLTRSTCAIMRFSFTYDSTVYIMTGNDTFHACDFTGAEEIKQAGTFSDGKKYVDFVLEQDMLDNQYYIASKSGCASGQKVAIGVINEYGPTYEACKGMGAETNRIQHCDCDHSVRMNTMTENCATGFMDGCRSQLPDDLSCCPGDDVSYERVGMGGNYVKGGSCIPKSKMDAKMKLAREVYEKCNVEANKETCDGFRTGACAWERVYNAGNWVYNTDKDGTAACDCTEAGQCTDKEGTCDSCMDMLAYGGDGKKMPEVDKYMGCDGDASAYNTHCIPWYWISHCQDLADGKELGAGFSGDELDKIKKDINEDECDASQDVFAYRLYYKDPEAWGGKVLVGLQESFAALSAMGVMFLFQA
jgi:hypothetical protein